MKKNILIISLIFLVITVAFGKKINHSTFTKHYSLAKEGNMKLTTVFEHNGSIPSEYTCDGKDLAPVLNVSEVPVSAKELVLIVDDPDAPMGTWVHWVLYNIPVNTAKIDNKNLSKEIKQGMTDFGRIGWGGPCPPSGTHRYFFKLYAVDKTLNLPLGATKSQVEKEIKGHIIEKTELIGLYKRR